MDKIYPVDNLDPLRLHNLSFIDTTYDRGCYSIYLRGNTSVPEQWIDYWPNELLSECAFVLPGMNLKQTGVNRLIKHCKAHQQLVAQSE